MLLDYLGRDDYNTISQQLYQEINQHGLLDTEKWLQIQIHFLEQHHYFTRSAIAMRKDKKELTLLSLKKTLKELK